MCYSLQDAADKRESPFGTNEAPEEIKQLIILGITRYKEYDRKVNGQNGYSAKFRVYDRTDWQDPELKSN